MSDNLNIFIFYIWCCGRRLPNKAQRLDHDRANAPQRSTGLFSAGFYRWINLKAENMKLLKMLFGSRKPALNKPVVTSSAWEQKLVGNNIHSVFTWCKDCHMEGCNIPFEDECGNCGSKNTVRYYDKETIDLLF